MSITAVGGYGSGTQIYTALGIQNTESPLGLSGTMEMTRFPSKDIRLAVLHSRSLQLAPFSTGLSYTMLTLRSYFMTLGPEKTTKTGGLEMTVYGVHPFVLAGFGISQGINSVSTSFGGAASVAAGFDVQFAGHLFMRFEGTYTRSFIFSNSVFYTAGLGLGYLF